MSALLMFITSPSREETPANGEARGRPPRPRANVPLLLFCLGSGRWSFARPTRGFAACRTRPGGAGCSGRARATAGNAGTVAAATGYLLCALDEILRIRHQV